MDRRTLGWYKCDICGRTTVVAECTLRPGLYVCPYCCAACTLRSECSKPVWFPDSTILIKRQSSRVDDEKKRIFVRRRLYRTG